MAGGIVLMIALFATALAVTPRRDARFPTQWDSRVEPLARFVADARGHEFKRPVFVNFMTPEQYRELAVGPLEVDPDTKAYYEELEAFYRALGLLGGNPDLTDTSTEMRDAATLAYYVPHEQMIYVRGTEMTASLKLTLVHELTHALQHQIFPAVIEGMRTPEQEFAARALVEGDAQRIEQEYFNSLAEGEQKEIIRQAEADYNASQSSLGAKRVGILSASMSAPYALGSEWAWAVAELPDGIDDAFDAPPETEAELIDLFAYLHRNGSEAVSTKASTDTIPPPAFFSGSLLGTEVGALTWYLLIAHHVDSKTAFTAVSGYETDRMTITRKTDGLCAELIFDVNDRGEQKEMRDALEKARLKLVASRATVDWKNDEVTLRVCDPGTSAPPQELDVSSLFIAPVFRNIAAGVAFRDGLDPTEARCAVDRVFASYDIKSMQAVLDVESRDDTVARRFVSDMEAAATACG